MGTRLRPLIPPHRCGLVRVWKVRAPPPASAAPAAGVQFGFDMGVGAVLNAEAQGGAEEPGDVVDEKWSASLVAELDDHKCVAFFNYIFLGTCR